jgi:queuosine precursor transporter
MEKSKNLDLIYHIINSAFCVIVVISNIISAKMVKVPFFEDFSIPAGLITYPLTFLLSNVVTEVYGKIHARRMVYIALGMNLLTLSIIQIAMLLPADTLEGQNAFQATMGLGGLRTFSSLSAYLISQVVDIQLYALIKNWTGLRFMWFRNNGSMCISQLVDTIVIDVIFLYFGLGMQISQIALIMSFSYTYKILFSLANTPLLYLFVFMSRRSRDRVESFS